MIVRSNNYQYKGKAAFTLSLEWCYGSHKYVVRSNISQVLINEVTKDIKELNANYDEHDRDKVMEVLDEIAHRLYKSQNAKYFYLTSCFSGERGRLINSQMEAFFGYQNTIHNINTDFVDISTNPILCYLLQSIAMNGLFCYDKFIKYMAVTRSEFESNLVGLENQNT